MNRRQGSNGTMRPSPRMVVWGAVVAFVTTNAVGSVAYAASKQKDSPAVAAVRAWLEAFADKNGTALAKASGFPFFFDDAQTCSSSMPDNKQITRVISCLDGMWSQLIDIVKRAKARKPDDDLAWPTQVHKWRSWPTKQAIAYFQQHQEENAGYARLADSLKKRAGDWVVEALVAQNWQEDDSGEHVADITVVFTLVKRGGKLVVNGVVKTSGSIVD
jgi:hypothetical protein